MDHVSVTPAGWWNRGYELPEEHPGRAHRVLENIWTHPPHSISCFKSFEHEQAGQVISAAGAHHIASNDDDFGSGR
ncbi:MAG: hypothetical protein R6V73_08460 [Anaerolineales bacterium]